MSAKMFPSEENQRRRFSKKKRRRTNEKMKSIIKNIEKEIESQLSAKDEKNDFFTTNIEAILKEVIMDEDVKEMVRQTIQQGDSKSHYEPKLTRAKIRGLLKLRPDLSFPVLWPVTSKKSTNFVSECLSLINANYSENSSEDEEYRPEEDDRNVEDASSVSSLDRSSATSAGDPSVANSSCCKDDTNSALLEPEENIGQRTRSKLPLTDTPLEVIEQAFVPPDITIDMYETEIDNEDWLNFIKGFVQPLDTKCNEPTDMDDDPDDDPEYNILNDVETVDREELRKDRGVDVPRQEVHDLIAELFRDCEPMNSMMGDISFTEDVPEPASEDPVPFDSIDPNDASTPANDVTTDLNPPESDENSVSFELPVLLEAQRRLLSQQMRQHVQLLTMNFLQLYRHPAHSSFYADEMKTSLVAIDNLSGGNENSAFSATNLKAALKLVNDWEKSHADDPHPKTNLFERFSKKRILPLESFSKEIMKTVTMSEVFLYPLLLPHRPFSSYVVQVKYKTSLLDSEEWLLAIGLEQFIEFVKQTGEKKSKDDILKEAINLITVYLLPCFTKKFLYHYVKNRCEDKGSNPIKMYFEKGKAPSLTHYVIPVVPKPLFKQPHNLLPAIWAEYVEKNYVVVKMIDTK